MIGAPNGGDSQRWGVAGAALCYIAGMVKVASLRLALPPGGQVD